MTSPYQHQCLIVILVCMIAIAPPAADAYTWSDDFGDGNFTANPSWTEWNYDDAPGVVEVTGDDSYVHFFRDAPPGNGGSIRLGLNVSLPVTKGTSIAFDVNPIFSDVVGGAGFSDGEYPAEVHLSLLDGDGNPLELHFCYNYRGGSSLYEADFVRVAFPYCSQGVWLRDETFRIRDYFRQAVLIERIELGADGWDFEGCIDNIVLHDDVYDDVDYSVAVPLYEQDIFYISITQPSQGGVYSPCAPDMVVWESDMPSSQGSPDVLDFYWRECGGFWHWFGVDSNDGTHPWPSAPCDPGCYEIRIQYIPEPSLYDSVEFEVVDSAGAPRLNIASLTDGDAPSQGRISPCVAWRQGEIAKRSVSGNEDSPNTVVETKGWGAIKALYR